MNTNRSVKSLEQSISEYGSIMWKVRGYSMEPLIHADSDVVVLEKAVHPLKIYDVAMYKSGRPQSPEDEHKYILHRVIGFDGDNYIILGDNCVALEYVRKEQIVAVMRGLLREGKEVDLNGLKHRLYIQLWIKPWRIRIKAVRLRGKIRRTWWKSVEIASPYTPRPVKEAVKKLIMR